MAWKAVREKGVAERREEEGWDHKVCREAEITYNLRGKQETTSDQCPSDFVLHFVWNYPVSNLKLYPDRQPSLILSAGWGQSVLSDSHYEDGSHTVLPPSFTVAYGKEDVGFEWKNEVKMKVLHWSNVWIFVEMFIFPRYRAHNQR